MLFYFSKSTSQFTEQASKRPGTGAIIVFWGVGGGEGGEGEGRREIGAAVPIDK